MPNPHPSSEQLRMSLTELAEEGSAERDPPIREEAKGITHKWRADKAAEEALASL